MKKIFTYVTALCLFSAPVAFTSCDEDDVKTALEIADLILGQGDVVGSWSASGTDEQGQQIVLSFTFQQNGQGAIVLTQGTEANQFNFTYTLSNNVITMTGSDVERFFGSSPYNFTVSSVTSSQLAMKDQDGDDWVFNRIQ